MTMPEAAVNKHHATPSPHHYVRFAGEIPGVRAKADPLFPYQSPYEEFGLRTLGIHTRHNARPLTFREYVRHMA